MPFVNEKKQEITVKVGAKLFAEGEAPKGLFLVRAGIVKLQHSNADGDASLLRLYGPGQCVGYRSLFSKTPYSADAVAVTEVTVCFLKTSDVECLLETQPQSALNLLECLSDDLKSAEDKWLRQIERSAPERIAEALLFLNDHFSGQIWSRKEIAQWAGTTTETVIRTLAVFEELKLISLQGRSCVVKDRSRLTAKAQGHS